MEVEFKVLSLDKGGAINKIKSRRAGGRGRGTEMIHLALRMFSLRCQQDLQLRMPSLLGKRFMSLNHSFRGKIRDYKSEYTCNRREYSKERRKLMSRSIFECN